MTEPEPGETASGPECLHDLFEARVRDAPDDIALECDGTTLSYVELDRRSNRVARALRRLGAGRGRYVVVLFERSELPVVAVLGCLKSGAAYVPVDPSHPDGRIRDIASQLCPVACATEAALAGRACAALGDVPVVVVDELFDERPNETDAPSPTRLPREDTARARDLAYVIYTSGTTGRPKGVMAEHRHVTRFMESFNRVCATTREDRVWQGFPLTFDGSVEEMWMAFSNGSTLVVPSPTAQRFGEDLTRQLREARITYFSTVPTLLSTLEADIPTLRTLVVSGEVCTAGIVERWARPGLRILNVYGATEATVNTTVAECVPGRPVTIGRPLPGYDVRIVDDRLRAVADGAVGELLVGGPTVSRGYLGQPELTAEHFPVLALSSDKPARFYRTGDMARWNDRGELEFLGRVDGQVKIRGYRVELAEIESVLTAHAAIRSAGVRLVERDGLQQLAAYVVTEGNADTLDRADVLGALESRLPAYMVPAYLDAVPELPRTTSGKIDRSRLPPPVQPLVREGRPFAAPSDDMECAIASIWSAAFGVGAVSVEDDFFTDLGGHSLVAAQTVTRLRERLGRPIALRDVYRFPTVRTLARHVASIEPEESGPDPTEPERRPVGPGVRGMTGVLQAASVAVISAMTAVPLSLLLFIAAAWIEGSISTPRLVALNTLVLAVARPALLLFSVAAKWLLVGRFRPGEHHLWTLYYWRWWLTERIHAASGAAALAGTPLLPVYYRLMGARVGARCTLDTAECVAWDLVSIGHDTSIGRDTQLLGYRIEDGMLRLGSVDVGSGCFVGLHCALGLNIRMGDGSALDDQSMLPDGSAVPKDERCSGSPALPAAVRLPHGAPPESNRRRAAFALAHLAALEGMTVATFLPPVLFLVAVASFVFGHGGAVAWGAAVASVPAGVTLYCLYLAGLKRAVLRQMKPGAYPVLSAAYVRKWVSDALMTHARTVLLPVYTTLYLPPLLRLMGARIGPRCELSTVWTFAPELVDIAPESFLADGCIVGGRRCHLGVCEVGRNRIGRRTFVGNSAVVPVGAELGDGCLIGVQSMPPGSPVADGTEWLGSPPFRLHHRARVGGFDDTVTFAPTPRLRLERAVIDALRILLPGYLQLVAVAAWAAVLLPMRAAIRPEAAVVIGPLVATVSGLAVSLAVAGLKRWVMGAYEPEIKPLWSRYVWLNEMVNGAYESVVAPAIGPLLGTPFAAPFLRLMGCRIGRGVYLGTTLFSEFDLVHIGDRVALNRGVVVQNHLFEDRIFKSSSLTIEDDASIGNMSVVLYGSLVGRRTCIGSLSLVMKGETLTAGSRWHGIPTIPSPSSRVPAGSTSPAPSAEAVPARTPS